MKVVVVVVVLLVTVEVIDEVGGNVNRIRRVTVADFENRSYL